jgi:hypothetical protein
MQVLARISHEEHQTALPREKSGLGVKGWASTLKKELKEVHYDSRTGKGDHPRRKKQN